MFFLMGLFFIWLMLTAVIGFALGWWLKSRSCNELALQLQRCNAEQSRLQTELTEMRTQLQDRITELENLKASPPKPAVASPKKPRQRVTVPPKVQKDDLKRIKGIGPVLEKKLNDLGILTFSQIAALKKEDIERISAQLANFKDRIVRDDWIAQAKKLSQ